MGSAKNANCFLWSAARLCFCLSSLGRRSDSPTNVAFVSEKCQITWHEMIDTSDSVGFAIIIITFVIIFL